MGYRGQGQGGNGRRKERATEVPWLGYKINEKKILKEKEKTTTRFLKQN